MKAPHDGQMTKTIGTRELAQVLMFAAAVLAGCAPWGEQLPATSSERFCPPVTSDRRWNDMKWDTTAYGIHVRPANEPPGLPTAFDPAVLRGEFDFVVVATAGVPSFVDTVRRGRLSLAPTDTTHRYVRCSDGSRCGGPGFEYSHFGYLDRGFHFPGLQSVATPLSSSAQDEPGAVAMFDSTDRELTLVLGNAYLRWTDSGVLLQVFRADSAGFTGRWVNGGLELVPGQAGAWALPQGHFCAWRVSGEGQG
jgi:hypothetical protein